MSKKTSYCVFIGRFQGFHYNHKAILDNALEKADKVIVLLGSANRPRTIKNPFTVYERTVMISSVYAETLYEDKIIFGGINDYMYNDQRWAMDVQSTVDRLIERDDNDPDNVEIFITGNKKDFSSYYIDLFPQWDYIEPTNFNEKIMNIHSSDIRNALFGMDIRDSKEYIKPLIPSRVFNYIEEFKVTPEFGYLAQEYGFIKDYKKSWEKAPYAPIFVTVDAVVIQSGHILLIKRRSAPGKGLWALPGGFLNQDELIETAMLRELHEETKIKVPVPVLKGNIRARKVFDHPDRSSRGRTVTHAFLIELPAGELPRIKGADDAEKAVWLPIADLKSENMFEDHYDLICNLLGRI